MFRHITCHHQGALVLLDKIAGYNCKILIYMCVDVAAYQAFCLLAFDVCIRVHTERKQTEPIICCHINTHIYVYI
jgi:hypothetical protein